MGPKDAVQLYNSESTSVKCDQKPPANSRMSCKRGKATVRGNTCTCARAYEALIIVYHSQDRTKVVERGRVQINMLEELESHRCLCGRILYRV